MLRPLNLETAQITQKAENAKPINPQKLKHAGPMGKEWREKAEIFAKHLTEVFTPHKNTCELDVENKLANLNKRQEKLTAFTIKEINYVIKQLHPRKAPGPDNITVQMIRELSTPGLKILLYILNATLRLEYWPTKYKLAKIIMLLKPAKPPTDVASYRPISLLPIISKILEKLILNRLTRFQNWIPEHQFGFRKEHSTIQQCHRLSDSINRALEEREYCSAVFLDISQAFDKVWHPGLLFKINQTLPPKYYNILKSYLQQRQLVVTHNDATSLPVHMTSGVPQGSVLGAFLYIIYTADTPKKIQLPSVLLPTIQPSSHVIQIST